MQDIIPKIEYKQNSIIIFCQGKWKDLNEYSQAFSSCFAMPHSASSLCNSSLTAFPSKKGIFFQTNYDKIWSGHFLYI